MKTKLEIGINFTDMYKNESLSQIINNMEKLEVLTDEVFNRINRNVSNFVISR